MDVIIMNLLRIIGHQSALLQKIYFHQLQNLIVFVYPPQIFEILDLYALPTRFEIFLILNYHFHMVVF